MTENEKPDLPPAEPKPEESTPVEAAKKASLMEKFLASGRRQKGGDPAEEAGSTPEGTAASTPSAMGPVRSLESEQYYGAGGKSRDMDDDIERELQEAMGGLSAEELLGQPVQYGQKTVPAGPTRKKGKVLQVHGQDVFVEVPGGRTQGVLPISQFPEGPPKLGDEVEITIEGAEDGLLILSRKGAAVEADWSSVAEGMLVEARVVETNKGGLTVDVNGIRGFMPISQIDLYRVEDAAQFVNQKLQCLVVEVNARERNLVVSRKELLMKEREELREKLWGELAEGQIREGVVRTVMDFGAFVDIGGVDGLLPISEMSWARVKAAADVVQPGQRIKVVVLRIDHERRKLSFGLRQLTASPWDDVEEKYHLGTLVTGKVSRLADFGAFVELEPAIEGLIHISELSPTHVRRVKDFVQEGQEVQVMVLNVEKEKRRISLSLKAAMVEAALATEESQEEEEETPPTQPRPRTTPLRGGLGG